MDNLWLCVAILLGMTLVIGLAQPFAQPQMNVLQTACFACASVLGLAIGFWSFGSWLLKTGMSLVARALISYRSQKLIGQHSQVVFFSSYGDLRPYSGSGGFPVPPGPGAAGPSSALRVAAAAAALARLARDVGVAAAAGTTRRQTQKCWLIG